MIDLMMVSRQCGAHGWTTRVLTHLLTTSLCVAFLLLVGCSGADRRPPTTGPSPERTPAEQLESFHTEPDLQIELVAAEPMVQDPVVCTFDEDGRLWVVEMRAYMPNIEGEGERDPLGRVSVLEDEDGDGTMDKSTVYLDSLIMPRALAKVANGVLVVWEEDLWMTEDLDGDLVADRRTLIDSAYAESTLPEHTANGLWRGIDNWYYNAKSRYRYRLTEAGWKKDTTEFRGQWGISHDDEGRLYYNYNWSQLHADLVPPNYLSRNKNHTPVTGIDQGLTLDRRVYPIRPTPAVNRGYIPGILDEQSRLKEFTAACSPFVFRGTALPQEYYGNVFVCEPSGNLIKRNVIRSDGLHLAAVDPHPGREFLASDDERFRPVHLAQGPDGALYIADMYRGVIQHKAYVTPYLKEQSLARGLVQPLHRGRIWRVVSNEKPMSRKKIKMSTLPVADLVDLLSDDDGWYRDMAQRVLVERNDKNAVPLLMALTRGEGNSLGRFHALWTLEGLNALHPDLLFELLTDKDPTLAATALRLLEPFAVANITVRSRLQERLSKISPQASEQEALQIALTASALDEEAAYPLLVEIATRYDTSALIREAILSSIGNKELQFMQRLLSSPSWKEKIPSREIFLEMLTSSVVRKRDPRELQTLLSMLNVSKAAFGWRERSILTGMSIQGYGGKIRPVRLPAEPRILRRNDLAISPSQRHGLASLFEWTGKPSEDVASQESTLSDKEKEQFALGRKFYLSSCSGCHGNDGAGMPRFAPPLRGSEWVLGDARRLALIVLHGIEGPLEVAGKRYAEPEILPVMPGHSTLDDRALSAILTYIRNEWGNQAGGVSGRTVGTIRLTHQGRVLPWNAEELEQHMSTMEPLGAAR